MPDNKPRFKLSAKKLFLTYQDQQGKMSTEILQRELKRILLNVNQIAIAEEESEDNYKHYHAFIELDKKLITVDPRKLDVNGIHGDYRTVKSKSDKTQVLKYIYKQGKTFSEGVNLTAEVYKGLDNPFEKFVYKCEFLGYNSRLLLKDCQTMEHYNEELFHILVDYEKSPSKYDRYINRRNPLLPVKNKPLLIHQSLTDRIKKWNPLKESLYIFGPSGTGKTTLSLQIAKNKGLLIRHKDEMKKIANHKAIIFDDMNFNKYSREECINLLDMDTPLQFDVKGSMVQVPKSISRIFTSNHPPHFVFKDFDQPMKRRIRILHIDNNYTPIIAKSEAHIERNKQNQYESIKKIDII